ncbi:hypothetical protein N7G274_009942 [Stereocaulon virgatum]|uniref:Uncharacterized protein n=1 Tax=Stereocaulon virgatum TaxID=373712 RepID=A0ABR4A1Q4_9LECA
MSLCHPIILQRYLCAFFMAVAIVDGASHRYEAEYYCGWETYGTPDIRDCRPLLDSFANYQDNSIRFFDEEQLRADKSGSWPGATSILGPVQLAQAVQVPRYYTQNTCNFALMSYIMQPDHPVCTMGASDWASINAAGSMLLTKCLLTGPIRQGGVVVIRSSLPPYEGALSLWTWASGSLFDSIINSFTNDPAGLIPTPGAMLNIIRGLMNSSTAPSNLVVMNQASVAVDSEAAS